MLEKYYEVAYRAYSGMSFSPEKRAKQAIKDYSEELAEDLKELGESNNYKDKYISRWVHWMDAKSRVMSPMITGPANFPVARNNKANRSEENAYNAFREWRSRYFEAVNRVPTPSPEEELDAALKVLDDVLIHQEIMKQVNSICRSKLTTDEKIALMVDKDLVDEKEARSLLVPNNYGGVGFEAFELRNNNAKIKRLKTKVETMKLRIQTKESFEPISFEGGKITIEDDRVCIYHDEKPEPEAITKLKSRGFRWSPKNKRWQRKHTNRAIFDAKQIVGISQQRRVNESNI